MTKGTAAQRFESVDDYISTFPPEVQTVLQAVRQTIRAAAPSAKESISYQIPTFSIGGLPVVYLAVGRRTSASIRYRTSTRSLSRRLLPTSRARHRQVRFGKPIPHELITVLVQRLVAQRS
jgi:uncharacterized protein YdhG (YjbR/CyaY superfamily)